MRPADTDGKFEVQSELGKPSGAALFFGRQRFLFDHADGADDVSGTAGSIASDLDLVVERTIEAPRIVVVPLPNAVDGATFDQIRGPLLAPCASGHALVYRSASGGDTAEVWVRAPARLPRVLSVPGGVLDFAADVPRSLRVVDDGGAPVAGAAVVVCGLGVGERLAEAALATLRTGDDGALRVWDSVPGSERVDRRNASTRK